MFRTALANDSTSPYYLLVTIRDGSTGATRLVCVVAPFLKGAIQRELGLGSDEPERREVDRFILSHPDHTFTLSKPEALANVAPRYTLAALQEVRQRLASYTPAQLRSQKILDAIRNDLPPEGDFYGASRDAMADAMAHALLEHGILCEQSDHGGFLYLAP